MLPSNFRPMLSASFDDDPGIFSNQLAGLSYPLLASAKLDGIRVLAHPSLGAVTRSLKAVRNPSIRALLSDPRLHYLDGEIILGNHEDPQYSFQRTESCVMSGSGETSGWSYAVFDHFQQWDKPFSERYGTASATMEHLPITTREQIYVLPHNILNTPNEVLKFEEECLNRGYEGIMLRHIDGPYKFGRSTLKQQGLIKLKRWLDDEAEIFDTEPLRHNQNEPTQDAFGLQKRSAHKDGKVEADTLGKLWVKGVSGRFKGVEFSIGSGFDFAQRDLLWKQRTTLPGQLVTYKYLPHGIKDAPRHPIFKAIRRDI